MVADHQIEGISDGFIPTIYERHKDEVTGIINVRGPLAIDVAEDLARTRGLFIGPSSGANVWAAQEIKRRDPSVKTVLTFLCDRGEKYLSQMYK